MKKILLFVAFISATLVGNSQEIVLNEVNPDPNLSAGNTEYLEIYNTTANPVNLDCYTIVSYYKENGGGAWVLNLPDITIPGFGHVVFGNALPLNYKGNQTYNGANAYSWNDLVWLAANFGSLTNYTRVGNDLVINLLATTTNDFIPISNGNDAAVALMIWKGTGTLSNALFTNSDIPQGSSAVISLNNLVVPVLEDEVDGDNCPATATFVFSTISAPAVEVAAITSAPGQDNNYYRTRDGFCGQWLKGQTTNNPNEFTPGTTNSNLPPINTSTAVTTSALQQGCTSLWNIGITITDATLLNATYRIYADVNNTHSLNLGDLLITSGTITTTTLLSLPNVDLVDRGDDAIIQIITASGCIQITRVFITTCAPLPVSFTYFKAARAGTNVNLVWQTSYELNNTGFAVERSTGSSWEQVGFVTTQAIGGMSSDLLTYTFVDPNNIKGISQYRLRQVDLDGQSKFSEIRSVRGEDQPVSLTVYPNPSSDGKVNVAFDDAVGIRNVSVLDMSGRVVRQFNGVTNNNITIENLMPGMYTVRVVMPETGAMGVQKIIVNKR